MWSNGMKHGEGKTKFPNGDTYVGYYSKDLMQGMGTYTLADGVTSWKGCYQEGALSGDG